MCLRDISNKFPNFPFFINYLLFPSPSMLLVHLPTGISYSSSTGLLLALLFGTLPLVGLVGVEELALVEFAVGADVIELFTTGVSLASGLDGLGEVGDAGMELLFCFFESPFICGTASFEDNVASLTAVEEGEDWLVVGVTVLTGTGKLPAETHKHSTLSTLNQTASFWL